MASPTDYLRRLPPPPPPLVLPRWLESVSEPQLDPANCHGRYRPRTCRLEDGTIKEPYGKSNHPYVWSGRELPHAPSHAAAAKNSRTGYPGPITCAQRLPRAPTPSPFRSNRVNPAVSATPLPPCLRPARNQPATVQPSTTAYRPYGRGPDPRGPHPCSCSCPARITRASHAPSGAMDRNAPETRNPGLSTNPSAGANSVP